MQEPVCPECENRNTRARLLLAWAAFLAGSAGNLAAVAALIQAFAV